MVQVAARCKVRGVLADDRGIALNCEDLEAMTDLPKADFEQTIPVLCELGWLECDSTDLAPSEDIPDSEQDTTTVQDNTVTEQNRTEHTVNSSALYVNRAKAKTNWDLLPKGRKIGRSKWNIAWSNVVEYEEIDHKKVMDAILKYYEFMDGEGEFVRQPATLIHDRVWEESPEVWKRNGKKPNDSKAEESAFAEIFGENEQNNK